MFLFLITGSIIWFFLMNTFFKFDGVRIRDFLLPVLKGIIVAIPALFIYWLYYKNISPDISLVKNYFYLFMVGDGFLTVFAIVVVLVIFLIKPSENPGSPIRSLSGYFAGFFLMVALRDLAISGSHNNILDLFMMPLLRMGLIGLVTILLCQASEEMGLRRILFFAAALLIPFISNFFNVFHFFPLLTLYAYFVALLFFIGGNFLYLLKIHKRIL